MSLSQITLALGLLFPLFIFGQNTDPDFGCAADDVMTQFYLDHPEKLAEQKKLEKDIYEKMSTQLHAPPPPYSLPVVVHIIHQNGPENISDAQVELAIEQLNAAFSHTGYYGGQGNGHDTQIQFCFAKQDPDGNATNGITRHQSPLTNMVMETEDIAMKDLARWEPLDYVNIYVVNGITSNSSGPGVAGYAYFPSSHGMPEDGLVCEAQYFGTSPAENSVLIHEMGHYLNLFHTFQGGCGNDDCLADGDRVCDTPPDQATHTACANNSCSTDLDDPSANNPLTSDVPDPTENYMDYSPFECYHAFTPGQSERMHMAVEMVRHSLLDSKGCFDPCTLPVAIDFTASATDIFAGQTVSFTNNSTGATLFEWSVDGVPFATTEDASFTFNDVGVFEVELFITNADANCFERLSIFITVKCPVIPDFTPSSLTVEVGEPFVATNISQNATDYEWYINGVLITTDTDLSFVFSDAGIYTVLLVATDGGCVNDVSQIIEVVSGSPCQDSVTNEWYHLNINGPLGFQAMAPNKDFFILSYPTFEDRVIFKIDEDENLLWSKKFDSPSVSFQNTTTNDGGLLFHFDSGIPNQRGICKLDENGNVLWAKSYSNYSFNKIDTYEDGALIYDGNPGGEFQSLGINNDGDVTWNRLFSVEESIGAETCKRNYDGTGWWCVGHNAVDERGGRVLKLNDVGDIEFYRRFIDTGNNFIFFADIAPTPDGGFVTVGERKDPDSDFIMAKFDSQGELEWERHIGEDAPTPLDETGDQVFLHPSGEYVGKYSTSFPDYLNIWFTCSTSGEISDLKSAVWENSGESLRFSLVKIDNQFYAYGNNPVNNGEVFLVDFSFETGPDLDCIEIIERQATPYSIGLTKYELSFNFLDTAEISDFTIGELPHNHEIIRTPACTTPCPEICDNNLDDDGDGYIDCFDEECECSNGTDCEAEEPTNNFAAELEWRSPNEDASSLATPMVANLDPQNGPMPEIIVQLGDSNTPGNVTSTLLIFSGDGSNQSAPVELEIQGGIAVNPVSPPTIGDVNGDGIPEVVMVCGDARVRAYTNFDPTANPPMELWAASTDMAIEKRAIPALHDFDSDGIAEVLVGNDVFRFDLSNPSSPQLIKALDGAGDYGRIGHPDPIPVAFSNGTSISTAVDVLTVTDCGGDPDCEGLEIVAGTHIYSIDLDIFDGDGMEIKIQRDLNVLTPGFNFIDGYTVSADVNLDGVLDVIVTSTRDYQEMGMYAWDKNGLIGFFPYPAPPPTGNGESYVSIAAVANVYDDTVDGYAQDFPEIICVSAYRLTAFNFNVLQTNPAQPYHWQVQTNDNSGYTAATIFDFNGDGLDEICYRDPGQMRIIYGGSAPFPPGVSFNRNWMTQPCLSATYGEAPVVADCDADGEAELIYTGKQAGNNNYTYTQGHLWVLGSANLPWVSCRPIWNQYGYFGVNVNDDLSIPANQQAHHLEFPGLGSGNRPFNQYLSQMPILGDDFMSYYPVPDASVVVDSSQCEGDSIRVWLTVCNEGSNGLPAEMPIVFYDSDPTSMLATPLAFPVELGTALLPDECATVEAVVLAQYNSPIYVVANYDWFAPTPIDPATSFPTTDITECDYENNFADFTEFSGTTNPPDLGPDLVICESSVITLDAGGPYDSYLWQDGSTEQIFTAFGPGTYWVTVQSECGSPLSDTIEITLDQSATFDLGPDLTLCPGESVELSVSGFDEVTWWPEEGLDCVDCPMVNASPTDTVTYYATGQNGDCLATDSVRVFVENFELEIDVEQNGCDTLAVLSAIVTGDGTYGYLWSNGETTDEINITESDIYKVTVTSQPAGCELADTVEINLGSLLVDSEITPVECANDSTGAIDLTPSGGEPPFVFSWENGAASEDLNGLSFGQYAVTVTDASGCSAELEFDLPATADFTVELAGDTLVNPDQPFPISAMVSPPDAVLSEIIWSPDGLPPQLTVNVMITDETLFTITVIDTSGCAATDDLLVRLVRPGNNVYFPNVFHPNSPYGDNLGFTGFGGEAVTLIRTLKIFDRWGGLVFDGKNLIPNETSMGWDGTAHGEPVNQGVYVFLAEIEFSDGETVQVTGDVMVVR